MELSCSYVALFAKRQSFELVSTAKSLDTDDATAYIYKQIDAAWAFRLRWLQGKNFFRYTFSRQGSNVWSGNPGQGSRPGAILGLEFDVSSEYFLALPDFVEGFVILFDNACKAAGDFPFFLTSNQEYQPRLGFFQTIDPAAVLKWLNIALKTADAKLYTVSGLKSRYPQHLDTKKDVVYTCSESPAVVWSHFHSYSAVEIRAAVVHLVATREVSTTSQVAVERLTSSAESGQTEVNLGSKSRAFNLVAVTMFGAVCILLLGILWQLHAQSTRFTALENQVRIGVEHLKKPVEDIGSKASNPDSNKTNVGSSSVETSASSQIRDTNTKGSKGEPTPQRKNNAKTNGVPATNDADKIRK